MLIIVVYVVADRQPAAGFLLGRQADTTDLLEVWDLDHGWTVIEEEEIITLLVCGVAMA